MNNEKLYRWKEHFIGFFTKKNFIKKQGKLGLLDEITYGNY